MKKLFLILIAVAIASFFFLRKDGAINLQPELHLEQQAKSMIVMDATNGKVLFGENSDETLPIASMSKLMTQYLVLNAVKNGSLSWQDTYTPSSEVLKISEQPSFSKLGMQANESYTIQELFTAMTVVSANDAAIALSEVVSGSESAFVELMNTQAKSLKMKNTTFYNSTGLDGNYIGQSEEETNLASAYDVAILAKNLLEKHPEVLEFTRLTDFVAASGERLWSTNLMLTGMSQAFTGIDGLKTGYTDLAGACFASTGVFNDRRYITVVIGVDEYNEDQVTPKFQLTKELILQTLN